MWYYVCHVGLPGSRFPQSTSTELRSFTMLISPSCLPRSPYVHRDHNNTGLSMQFFRSPIPSAAQLRRKENDVILLRPPTAENSTSVKRASFYLYYRRDAVIQTDDDSRNTTGESRRQNIAKSTDGNRVRSVRRPDRRCR